MMIRFSQIALIKWTAVLLTSVLLFAVYSCTTERASEYVDIAVDTDGDGVLDTQEVFSGTNKNDPCDPAQESDYSSYDPLNAAWQNSDCDADGITNADELSASTNPYYDESLDSDGDGVSDSEEIQSGSDKDNPCDPFQNAGYLGFNLSNPIWISADCDGDGMTNGDEITNETDPYFDEIGGPDTDGDGVKDARETLNGTDLSDPCDPVKAPGYEGYDPENAVWASADCDGDGITNADEHEIQTDPYLDDGMYAIPQFLPILSELRIFEGAIADLTFIPTVFEYGVSTPLFTDYAYKLRSIAIPNGQQLTYTGEGLFDFPDNTILTETIYYLNDERDLSQGKKIIETRVLIKMNGAWNVGKYVWNEAQTEADLTEDASVVQVNWIDSTGNPRNVAYRVPPNALCFQCHNINGGTTPVGIKARGLNFEYNGSNQLQNLIDNGLLTGAPDVSQIAVFPDWTDETLPLEDRARAYLDVNCAHCHQPGGSYNISYGDAFELRYETSFEDSNIFETRVAIRNRMNSLIPSYFMPFLGTTVLHDEGVALVNSYIDSLE